MTNRTAHTPQAVDWLCHDLRRHGVEWMATLCGHGLDPLFAAAKRAGLRLVDARNEQTASFIAGHAGRLTGRPGVCAVSSGVAHANAMTGVTDAWLDGAPMLLLTGAGDARTEGFHHFQDLDQAGMARPVTRFADAVRRPERICAVFRQAWLAANGPEPGPAHITLPMDVQSAAIEQQDLFLPGTPAQGAPEEDPEPALRALQAAERPLLIAGSGAFYSGEGAAVVAFAREFAVPITTPIWDRGVVDAAIPEWVGVMGAASGGTGLLAEADCVVLAGARPDYRLGFLAPPAIQADASVAAFTRGWETLAGRYRATGGRNHTAWRDHCAHRARHWRQVVQSRGAHQAGAKQHAIHVVEALRETAPEETSVLIDGGSIGQWMHHLHADRYPSHWLTCGRSGVVGWGLGGAMAARVVNPDRPVVLVSGDGAFTFTVAELECAVRQKLPFVAIVADDQAWGITKTGHERRLGGPISSTLGPIAFDRLAESLGARGVRAETPDALRRAIADGLASGEVTVIHAPVTGGDPSQPGPSEETDL